MKIWISLLITATPLFTNKQQMLKARGNLLKGMLVWESYLKGWKNKMNSNELASRLEEKLDCVVLHTPIKGCTADEEMFVLLSQSASNVKVSFAFELNDCFIYNFHAHDIAFYELDKYLKVINEIMERGE